METNVADEACDDWEEAVDPTFSAKYYYNVRTRESTWLPPPRFRPAPQRHLTKVPELPLLQVDNREEVLPPKDWTRTHDGGDLVRQVSAVSSRQWFHRLGIGHLDQSKVAERSPSGYRLVPTLDEDGGYSDVDFDCETTPRQNLQGRIAEAHFQSAAASQHVAVGFFTLGLLLGMLIMGFVAVGSNRGRSDSGSPVLMSVWKGWSEMASAVAGGNGPKDSKSSKDSDVFLDVNGPTGGKVLWSGHKVRGECLPGCGGRGGWCAWCGPSQACCRAKAPEDPPECKGGGGDGAHVCTTMFANVGEQCGGEKWIGARNCTAGYGCLKVSDEYYECQPHYSDTVAQDYTECGWVKDGKVWKAPCVTGSECKRIDGTRSLCLPSGLLHPGEDCFAACGGTTGDCIWCGAGNACCISNGSSGQGPPECEGVVNFLTSAHECVVPVAPVLVKHQGQDCFAFGCHGSGDCPWCGEGNACCFKGAKNDPPECTSVVEFSTSDYHTCVAPVNDVLIKHQGQDCWGVCGKGGFCDWCGRGNACCRLGVAGPQECQGAAGTNKDAHTCVKPPLTG